MLKNISDVRLFGVVIVLFAIAASIFSVFFLRDRGALIWLPFAFALPAAILHTGAAFLVWSGLGSFKSELRRAYKFICVAVIFVGFTQLQLPVISIFGWWELRENGLIIIPFILPFIFFAVGLRQFTHQLNIRTKWASPWLIHVVGIGLGAAMTLVPHAPSNVDQLTFGFTVVLLSWIAVNAFSFIMVVLRIKHAIGANYVNALAWLCVTYISVLITDLMYLVTLMTTSPGNWYLDYNISVAPFIVVGLLWIRAGYAFNAITATTPAANHLGRFFGPTSAETAGAHSSYPSVDIVVHVASQASNPGDIDNLLDDLRLITANHTPGQSLSKDEESRLAALYLKIEEYLTSSDPLRTFTRFSIRQDIENGFLPEVLARTFWPSIQRPDTLDRIPTTNIVAVTN